MSQKRFAIIAIGNIVQKDDGMALIVARYLRSNYRVEPTIDIIEGGVAGMQLLNTIMEYDEILFLDCIDIDAKPGSIYYLPTVQLKSASMVQNSAHEVGILESLSMLELMGETIPPSNLLGIVPKLIETDIGLSSLLLQEFDHYISHVVQILGKSGYTVHRKEESLTLDAVIESFRSSR